MCVCVYIYIYIYLLAQRGCVIEKLLLFGLGSLLKGEGFGSKFLVLLLHHTETKHACHCVLGLPSLDNQHTTAGYTTTQYYNTNSTRCTLYTQVLCQRTLALQTVLKAPIVICMAFSYLSGRMPESIFLCVSSSLIARTLKLVYIILYATIHYVPHRGYGFFSTRNRNR